MTDQLKQQRNVVMAKPPAPKQSTRHLSPRNERCPQMQLLEPERDRSSMRPISLGQSERTYLVDQDYVTISREPSNSLENMREISNSPSPRSSPRRMPLNSPTLNGRTLSSERWLTSTTSFQEASQSPAIIEKPKLLEGSNSSSELPNLSSKLKHLANGSLPGACTLKRQRSLSPTASQSSTHMVPKSSLSSQQRRQATTPTSSRLTKRSESGSVNAVTSCSRIMPNLTTFASTGSTPSAQVLLRPTQKGRAKANQTSAQKIPATDGTEVSVARRPQTANIDMFAKNVGGHIRPTSVKSPRREELEPRAKRPRYTRGLLWDDEDEVLSSTAQYSLTAAPVPRVPIEESANQALMDTIHSHPHLFSVNCRLNVERFAKLLQAHPNQPFVKSVCHALREGFWPFADTKIGIYPVTYDFSDRPPKSDEHAAFIEKQVETEVHLGRYSEAFGPDLLPGMYSSPVHAVPKPGSDALSFDQ
jgi:hypothetical protein